MKALENGCLIILVMNPLDYQQYDVFSSIQSDHDLYLKTVMETYEDAQYYFKEIYVGKLEMLLHRKHATHFVFRQLPNESSMNFTLRQRGYLMPSIVPLPPFAVSCFLQEMMKSEEASFENIKELFHIGLDTQLWRAKIPEPWLNKYVQDTCLHFYTRFSNSVELVREWILEDPQSKLSYFVRSIKQNNKIQKMNTRLTGIESDTNSMEKDSYNTCDLPAELTDVEGEGEDLIDFVKANQKASDMHASNE